MKIRTNTPMLFALAASEHDGPWEFLDFIRMPNGRVRVDASQRAFILSKRQEAALAKWLVQNPEEK